MEDTFNNRGLGFQEQKRTFWWEEVSDTSYVSSHILFAGLLLHPLGQPAAPAPPPQPCVCLSFPHISPSLPVNQPGNVVSHSEAWARQEEHRLLTLPDEDSLSWQTTPRHMLSSSQGAPEGWAHCPQQWPLDGTCGWAFPPPLFPLFQHLLPVPLNHLLKSTACIQTLVLGSAFWGFLVQASRGHGQTPAHTGAARTCSPAPSFMPARAHRTHQLGSFRVCFILHLHKRTQL